jgi:Fe-Mn family superoxide dismutase
MYTTKNYNLINLKNISKQNIDEHLKLYTGYVNHTNLILNQLKELDLNKTENIYIANELNRRLSFELNGVKNHENYFYILSDGFKSLKNDSSLYKAIEKDYLSFENWLNKFKNLALTRGPGWAMLSYDKEEKKLINHWVDEQHIGHLANTKLILSLDMWEHAFVYDYPTSEKKKYIEAFFENLNWENVEKIFLN